MLHWISVDLLCDSTPVGKIASTNLPCAVRLFLHVACKYWFVTFRCDSGLRKEPFSLVSYSTMLLRLVRK
jgi:hypothetical protein